MSPEAVQPSSHERRLFAILADCLSALERNSSLTPADLAARVPEFAAEIVEFLNDSQRMRQWSNSLRDTPLQDGAEADLEPSDGRLGDYELCSVLGRGANAVVYRARKIGLNRFVALKVLTSLTESALRRFRLEIEVVAALDHPHIVPVYDVGEAGGRPFFTMKLFEGGSLADGRWRSGETPWPAAAKLIEIIARAVHAAHRLGIVHRDLKPANVLLDVNGRPYVADFGLARWTSMDARLTHSGTAVGTPAYMAPEQLLGREPGSVAADIYSLGAILYELLTGRRPHAADDAAELLLQIIQRDPFRPRELAPQMPYDLETVCLKCLESDPARRYQTADALAADLDCCLTGRPVAARRPGLVERASRWIYRHRPAALSAATVIAVSIAATIAIQSERIRQTAERERLAIVGRDELARQHYFRTIALAERERSTKNAGLAERLLAECPPGLRGWEWAYLDRQRYGGRSSIRLPSHLFCVALTLDGLQFAAGAADGSLAFGNVLSGEPVVIPSAHAGQVRGISVSPNGDRIASAGWDGTVRLWETASRRCVRSWAGAKYGFGVSFSPDGRVLAAAVEGEGIDRWDMTSGVALPPLRGLGGVIRRLAFRPGGRDIAAVNDEGRLAIWNAATGELRRSIAAHEHLIFDVQYDAAGKRIVTAGGQFVMHGDAGVARVWDADDGSLLQSFPSRTGPIYVAALSSDGSRLFTGGEDGIVRIRDVASGAEALALRGHGDAVWGLSLSRDGDRLVTASGDHTLRVWDATPLASADSPELFLAKLGDRVTSIAFSPDGRRLVAATLSGNIHELDAGNGSELRSMPVSRGPVHGIAFRPDGERFAAANWRLFSDPDSNGSVSEWDARAGRELRRTKVNANGALGVTYSPDGRRLLAAADHAAVELDSATGAIIHAAEHPALVTAVAWGADASAVGTADGVAEIRAGNSIGKRRSIAAHQGRVFALAFSPDGALLASGGVDGKIRLWRAATGDRVLELAGHAGGTTAIAFAPDGHTVVTGGHDAVVRIWDCATGKQRRSFGGHADAIQAIAVSPDGRRAASGGRDRTVRVWSLEFNSVTSRSD